ncbi:MAG TPA: conjugal transfer protein TrbF [Methylomusa anaerophila]|uniref:VirB8 protein n=1 Tax=Methylomusa anaerophila TaxID=1930071 RepID=A0A348AN25_9FIRM|nr:conjugal transfer protein TrbF [Methylomusa anaerophila]BBB92473.1 VirB8 protein [Methylomusa anaerophila]HML87675.1 conjugal transfer protein TrbF [Methylomusa anaerophila]
MKIREFFFEPKQYANSSTPKTPFDQAKEEWDRREGHIVVQNYNLRRLLLLSWLVLLVISAGLVVQSLKSSVVPYVVEVDSTTGVVRNAGLAEAQAYTPQAAELKYFLSQFIRNIRSLPLDPVVYKMNMEAAYGFLTKQAANKMSVQLQNENPLEHFGKETVQVKIGSMLAMTDGSSSYQIRWTEDHYDIASGKKTSIPMNGIFTIRLQPPRQQKELEINPLGIFIADFNWTQEGVKGE